MKRFISFRRFLISCFAFALMGCQPSGPTSPFDPLQRHELPRAWPKSAELEAKWGAPEGPVRLISWNAAMRYKDPKNPERYVKVAYLGQKKPEKEIRNFDGTRAVDGQLEVMGQTVDFYGSGNEIAEISTHPILLKSPSGWSGWFVFVYSPREYRTGRNLPAFAW